MQSSFCGRFEKHLTKSYILIYLHEYNSDVFPQIDYRMRRYLIATICDFIKTTQQYGLMFRDLMHAGNSTLPYASLILSL